MRGSTSLKNFFQPSQNLLNIEPGTEETSTVPTQYSFYPVQQQIQENIKNYNTVPAKYFINESYFLYDKSNLIKETYIFALNKRILRYGSICYFDKKTENEILKIISPENLLKFIVKKNTNKDSLSSQLISVSGNLPVLKNKNNGNVTYLPRKEVIKDQSPTTKVCIVYDRLNPIQIEIEDDRVLYMLKIHKNVMYKLTPLGILFPASIKNNTEQVFITCREVNDVKKALINSKIYGLLGITEAKKFNNWKEIKGQSIWINAALEKK